MKIYITGPAGSGKSTLAKKLSDKYLIPVFHLDEFLFLSDDTENPNYHQLQLDALEGENWIIEGASCSIIQSMTDVDKILVLNYSPIGNIFRIIFRRIKSLIGRKRAGFTLNDSITLELLRKSYTWEARQLPRILKNVKEKGFQEKLVILKKSGSEI